MPAVLLFVLSVLRVSLRFDVVSRALCLFQRPPPIFLIVFDRSVGVLGALVFAGWRVAGLHFDDLRHGGRVSGDHRMCPSPAPPQPANAAANAPAAALVQRTTD